MALIPCLSCGTPIEARRVTKKFCSPRCSGRYRTGYPKTRSCPECGSDFQVLSQQLDAARKYCCYRCSHRANNRKVKQWQQEHPEEMEGYFKKRAQKYPGMWREKARSERLEALALLGGACAVCGVRNTNWLHLDYIPTTRGKQGRHPRHLAFIRTHLTDFRILCANHHYELTLTGQIEGAGIKQ